MSLNENQLIESAQGGDVEAFSQLARRFERRIYTLALHYTRVPADAEDLSQEVWLKAFKAINSFRGDATFYTWLRQIMVNTFLNHKRAEYARVEEVRSGAFKNESSNVDDDLSFMLDERPYKVEEDYERRILVERVMRALGCLSSQQRLIFLLKHREGMTYEEISKAFGCSVGSVKKALFRAVQKLREQMCVSPAPLEYLECGAGRK
ncbi:MAG TPA: sigma-70 family RNA polymerase sigma factor [Pyrinomonadaceae bacterium]|nr:sigma-70 family RNA polymerase sigma factor [Pyrinomonadaceae bacterium]